MENVPTQRTLQILSEVSAIALVLAEPVRFRVANTAREREAAFRLRYDAVMEHGWAKPEDYTDKLERDEYDDMAVHIVGWDGEIAVATTRLVFPHTGHLLPIEAAFDLQIEPHGRVVDMGRVVVAPLYRNKEKRILGALLAAAWNEIVARGFIEACGAFATEPLIRLYRSMGFTITPLAPPRQYWGGERIPIHFDVTASAEALATYVERVGSRGTPSGTHRGAG